MTYLDGPTASAGSFSEDFPANTQNRNSEDDKLSLLLNELEKKLTRMEEVLSQIDTAGYGKCEECGADIGTEILRSDPLASRCGLHRGSAS